MKRFFLFHFFLFLVYHTICFAQKFSIKFFDGENSKVINYELKRPKIALVLSGGGARGLSHIGVLKVFEKYNIPIDCIIGTSMGSIVGGLYCAGLRADEIEKLALETNWNDILSLGEEENRANLFLERKYLVEKSFIYFRFKGFKPLIPSYVTSGQKINESLLKIFFKTPFHFETDYENLNPKFYSVATDLVSGRRVVFSKGNLIYTIRASATIPLVFQPVMMDSLVLVDGGLISNIPADIARELGYDVVITVDATSPLRTPDEIQLPWNTADQIVGIMMQLSNKFQLEKSDIVLKPDLENISSADFDKAKLIIQKGEEIAEEKIEEVISLIESKYQLLSDAEIGEIENYKLKVYGDGLPADFLASFYEDKFSIDDFALKMALLLSTGEYKKVDVEIRKDDEHSEIKIETELNPEIKIVNVFPQSIENFKIKFEVPTKIFRNFFISDSCFTFIPKGKILFSERNVFDLSREILRIFHSNGFPFVKVKNVIFNEGSGILNIYTLDGFVSDVKIYGNKKTRKSIILRDVYFKRGDVLTQKSVIETIQNLWATNLFSQIRFNYKVNDSVEVELDLNESVSQFLRFGFRIDNERGTQIFSDFRDENTFGLNDNFGATFQGGMRNSLLKLEYRVDRFLQTMLTYGVGLFHSERKVYTYGTNFGERGFSTKNEGEIKFIEAGAEISVGGQFEKLGNTLLKYQIEKALVKNVSRINFKDEENLLAKLQLGISIDSRDRAYFPSRGVYLNTYYEMAQKFLGSDVSYSKIFFAYENYNTYFKYGTLKFKFLFGLCDESTPLSQQFFLGSVTGLNSFAGMREDEIYGRQVILGGIEVRFRNPIKILFNNFISLRYDFGSAWEKLEAIRWKDLRQGLGFELGFETPIGALRIKLGKSFIFRTVKQETLLWGQTVFHFSLGFE
ncbi:patatin-like phospholipase family protein [Candidatus Chrysopegis kryptomonas]|uniref:NTE family protein n=1 Tax=Candidatus Chryseopegocella kryptomonas TaxID=1633643 RepID=A0A0P1NV13_9BACT|nr:patatin-like phospholipase family protein [Candidatus Chrysopegis kryptomonas]CUT02992.1 NTE family protein [Candidatus Chrysopegis kryptomonas]